MSGQEIFSDVWPGLLTLFGALVTFCVGYLTHKSGGWVDVQNNEVHDAVIDSAIHNGIAFAQEGQAASNMANEAVQTRIREITMAYVKGHAAKSLEARGKTDAVLEEMIRARLAPAIMASLANPSKGMTVAAAATAVNPDIPTTPLPI